MTVITALLIFALLIFAPIRVVAKIQAEFYNLTLLLNARIYGLTIFNETFALHGKHIDCSGSVNMQLDLTSINTENGVDLFKCITVDSFALSLQNNLLNTPQTVILAENVISAVTFAVLESNSNCKVYGEVVGCLGNSRALSRVSFSFNLFELILTLIKQGVLLWMRKSAK